MNLFAQGIISGFMIGAVYALLGVGLVLVYRTAGLLNLAHGESFAVAGIVVAALSAMGVPLALCMVCGLVVGIAFPLALHRLVLRPRADWPIGTLILVTLGAAFLMRGLMMALVGADPVSFPRLFGGPPLRLAGGALPSQGLALIIVGFGVSLAVTLFLTKTRLGKELLATAENPLAAELLGVNVEAARLLAFGLSGALAAIAALLLVPLISVDAQGGLAMTLRGFIAAALAGMSPLGTVLSGLCLGLFEALVAAYFGALFQDPVIFLVLIAVALARSRKIRFGGGRRA